MFIPRVLLTQNPLTQKKRVCLSANKRQKQDPDFDSKPLKMPTAKPTSAVLKAWPQATKNAVPEQPVATQIRTNTPVAVVAVMDLTRS